MLTNARPIHLHEVMSADDRRRISMVRRLVMVTTRLLRETQGEFDRVMQHARDPEVVAVVEKRRATLNETLKRLQASIPREAMLDYAHPDLTGVPGEEVSAPLSVEAAVLMVELVHLHALEVLAPIYEKQAAIKTTNQINGK